MSLGDFQDDTFSESPGKILETCMIKLIFNKVEDISKTAFSYLEKNFFTVMYLGFCRYLSIVKTLRRL